MHGQCALVDSVNKMSRTAMVACIQALDGAAGVKRATPKGNKATIKQRLQEMREAERIRRAAVRDSRTQEAEAEAAKLQAMNCDEQEAGGEEDREGEEEAEGETPAQLARCVERAATGGWASSGTGRGCSHEYDPGLCASHVRSADSSRRAVDGGLL